MDARRVDRFARILSAHAARRDLLRLAAALPVLGALAALLNEEATGKDRRQRRKRRRRKNRKRKRACYPGTRCTPGPGHDNAGCDFSASVAFLQRDLGGANVRNANFAGAQMAGANLQGADLNGACLVEANLLNATIDGTTKLDGAIFCHTVMPDGSINDDGCGQATRCCPAPDSICQGCADPDCINSINTVCSILGTPCCPGLACTATASIALTSCQAPCDSDEDCLKVFGAGSGVKCCAGQTLLCPFFPGARCCQPPGYWTC